MPYVQYSNCNYCRVAKVIVGNDYTKVLIKITGQRGRNPWVSFSSWTFLMPYNSDVNLTKLRNYDLNIPNPPYTSDANLISLWKMVVNKKREMQKNALEIMGEYRIINLENGKLDTKYNIKSKTGEVFNFWLTFNRLPPGVENIMIIELVENGFEWIGIKIKNPDTSPKTNWDENTLKEYWESVGMVPIEGIYENTVVNNQSSKYKLALKYNKSNNQYELIYVSRCKKLFMESWRY